MTDLTWRGTAYQGPYDITLEAPASEPTENRLYRGAKRCLDTLLAGLGLLALMPLFPLVALAIRLDSPGPVLFSQTRVGEGGREFRCWKLRSMYIDAEARKQELESQNEMKRGDK